MANCSRTAATPLLSRRQLRVGRRDSCDICLRLPNVSGLHCELAFRGGYWTMRDLNSTNGTKVNGERVMEAVLYPGDRITIGKGAYTIRYTPPGGLVPASDRHHR